MKSGEKTFLKIISHIVPNPDFRARPEKTAHKLFRHSSFWKVKDKTTIPKIAKPQKPLPYKIADRHLH